MPNSGVFCGLHVDTKSTSSRCATPDQSTSLGPAIQANQRRPHSLTLPFENRERRSHLVSEEEFDKIIRRAKLDQPLPPLPPGVCNDVPQHRKRSSISVATNPRISSLSQRPRPMSADFSTVISTIANRHEAALQIPRALPKDLTLTALPRPPTKNDLIIYPSDSDINNDQLLAPENNQSKHLHTSSVITKPNDANAKGRSIQGIAGSPRGHKRQFSAAAVVELVKKRLGRANNELVSSDPELDVDGSNVSKTPLENPNQATVDRTSSAQYQFQRYTPIQPDEGTSLGEQTGVELNVGTEPTPKTNTKSLLKRTWSKKKQYIPKVSTVPPTAKQINGVSKPHKSSPLVPPYRPSTSTSHHTTSDSVHTVTTSQTATAKTADDTSAEHSPVPKLDDTEFISGPKPKRSLITRLGGPPTRVELNTVVARQQSRIVDLMVLNNSLVGQVEALRGEVEDLKIYHGGKHFEENRVICGQCDASEDCDQAPCNTAEVIGSVGIANCPYSESDPNGWRRIVGIPEVDHLVEDGDGDDKRKTWMTCDS